MSTVNCQKLANASVLVCQPTFDSQLLKSLSENGSKITRYVMGSW